MGIVECKDCQKCKGNPRGTLYETGRGDCIATTPPKRVDAFTPRFCNDYKPR